MRTRTISMRAHPYGVRAHPKGTRTQAYFQVQGWFSLLQAGGFVVHIELGSCIRDLQEVLGYPHRGRGLEIRAVRNGVLTVAPPLTDSSETVKGL